MQPRLSGTESQTTDRKNWETFQPATKESKFKISKEIIIHGVKQSLKAVIRYTRNLTQYSRFNTAENKQKALNIFSITHHTQ